VLFGLVIFIVAVTMIGLAAGVAGTDTRDGNDWFLHRPA
jgi:hypothetical protein